MLIAKLCAHLLFDSKHVKIYLTVLSMGFTVRCPVKLILGFIASFFIKNNIYETYYHKPLVNITQIHADLFGSSYELKYDIKLEMSLSDWRYQHMLTVVYFSC